ncbi:MAG: transcriptional repressor [Bacteroidales bacterium]|nr:transcriptional repressor [Bacteroidales bacterium]
MYIKKEDIGALLKSKGLRVTPQRIEVFEAITRLNNHPSAEQVKEYLYRDHPSIAIGTVYNILDTYVENNILKKVFTDDGVTRYDPIIIQHHHLYCAESERIEDYYDDSLDKLLKNYFKRKRIPGFSIENMRLQIVGKFKIREH